MVYEDNYAEYLEDCYVLLNQKKPKTGFEAQNIYLNNTDDSLLTERERLIIILPLIKYEVEHDMLTPEIEDELFLYIDDFRNNRFKDELGEDEEEQVLHDLYECYNKVFN